jgi:hypothetical protein
MGDFASVLEGWIQYTMRNGSHAPILPVLAIHARPGKSHSNVQQSTELAFDCLNSFLLRRASPSVGLEVCWADRRKKRKRRKQSAPKSEFQSEKSGQRLPNLAGSPKEPTSP